MNLTPAQSIIAKDKHRFRVVNCGRRFGKTTLSAWEMVGYGVFNKNARVPYYAPTRDDARDIMWKMLNEIASDLIVNKNESRLELEIKNNFGGTSLLALYGWEAVQQRKKGVGVKNNFIVLDEVSKYRNFWTGWEEVLRPTLIDLKGDALLISTPNGFNHFYDLFNLESKDNDFKSFHFTSYDNPFVPVDEIEKMKLQMTEDRFAQEVLADFRKTEGLVYKEFKREVHVYDKIDEIVAYEVFVGIDFGFSNPAAVLKIIKDYRGEYWVEDEWYYTGKTNQQLIDAVRFFNPSFIYPDPEDPKAIEELKSAGFYCRDVSKGRDSIINGIDKIRELFKQNKIHISSKCKNLIWELESYHYPEESIRRIGDIARELPVPEDNHALDALRYALMMNSTNPGRIIVTNNSSFNSNPHDAI